MSPKHLESPLPADFDSAIKEIVTLRKQLILQNEQIAARVQKNELDRRANQGSLKEMRRGRDNAIEARDLARSQFAELQALYIQEQIDHQATKALLDKCIGPDGYSPQEHI